MTFKNEVRVAVLGAGFSGLSAARTLVDRGADVTVYEARDRVGGRVWSRPLKTSTGDSVVERGAEFVLEGYDELRVIAAEAGLELVDTGMSYYVRELAETPHISTNEIAAAGGVATKLLDDFDYEPSVAEVLDKLDVKPEVKAGLKTRIEISTACEAGSVSAVTLRHTAAFAPKPSWRVGNGNQQIAFHLADKVGPRILFEDPVRSVERLGDRFAVSAERSGRAEFDYVIVALPLSFVRNEDLISLPLSDEKRESLKKLVQGHAAKLHIPLGQVPPTSAVLSVPGRFWTWTAVDSSGSVAPVVHSLVATLPGIDEIGAKKGDELWLSKLKAIRPDLDLDLELGRYLTVWSEDEWARGGFSSHAPGWTAKDDDVIQSSEDGLYLVGEYVDAEFTCLMEGALRTGKAAALDVADRIAARP
ncbi:MAG: flavin monoamine oxidase family protein [Actinomycetota bacterium]